MEPRFVASLAFRHWLKQQAQAAMIRAYEAGYRKMPEGKKEIAAAQAAAVRLLATEEW